MHAKRRTLSGVGVLLAALFLICCLGCGGGSSEPSNPTPSNQPPTPSPSPAFSPAAGNYTSPQLVTITYPTQGATIYYTTDGSTPTTSSPIYTGTFTISATATLKAIAKVSGTSNSGIGSATYTITLPTHAATSYYVAPGGSDSALGTLAEPFGTIQFAASQLAPGDTLYLRDGNYHETVSVQKSGTSSAPITIRAYPGETPTLSGAKPVAGPWTVHSGLIYKTAWPQQPVQVFADGQLLNEARWPNQPLLNQITDQVFAITDAGTETSITKAGLPSFDLTGAWIGVWSGENWVAHYRQVSSHDQSTGTLSFLQPVNLMTVLIPRRNNDFFVFGKLELLDAPGEWWWDPSAKMLYVWMPDGGTPDGRVEAGTAPAVLDLSSQTHVIVKGLSARGGWFNLQNCSSCAVRDCHLLAPTWIRTFDGYSLVGQYYLGGVDVSGIGNTVEGGSVRLSGRTGIHLAGFGNTVRQMTVEDSSVNGTNNAAVSLNDSDQALVENCTVRRSNGNGIFLSPRARVLKNLVEDSMLYSNDAGSIAAWGLDGQGSEIAYNIIRGNRCRWGAGIYLDNGSLNFYMHDNLFEDILWHGINLSAVNIVENNTFDAVQHEVINIYPPAGTDMSTARVTHNLLSEPFPLRVDLMQPVTLVPEYAYFCADTTLAPMPDPRRVELDWTQFVQPGWSVTEVPMDLSAVDTLEFSLMSPATTFSYSISNLRLLPVGETGDAGAVAVSGTTWTAGGENGSTCTLSASGPSTWDVKGTNPRDGKNYLRAPVPVGLSDFRSYRGLAFELAGSATMSYAARGCQERDNGPEAVPGRGATLPAQVGANP